jgi:NTP pyrophosphatase (non-canonical NTP hydrolase)
MAPLELKIEKIHKLNCEMFPENSKLSSDAIQRLVAQACEELGEIHGTARSYFGRTYSPEKTATLDHIAEEVGDAATIILLIGHLFYIPLEKSLDMVIEKLEDLQFKKKEDKRIEAIMRQDAKDYEPPYDASKWYKPDDNKHYDKVVLKFDASQHQPFKYDLEDPINY